MKKIIRLLCVLCLCFTTLMLGGCKKPAEAPAGYQTYNNKYISFAYPETWKYQTGSVDVLINEDGVGTNITVAYEKYSNLYSTLTTESFNESSLKTQFTNMGMQLSNESVSQSVNKEETKITTISYSAYYNNTNMNQTLYIVKSGSYNYVVTITEVDSYPELVQTVFDTLVALK